MAKEQAIEVDGVVEQILPNTMFRVWHSRTVITSYGDGGGAGCGGSGFVCSPVIA